MNVELENFQTLKTTLQKLSLFYSLKMYMSLCFMLCFNIKKRIHISIRFHALFVDVTIATSMENVYLTVNLTFLNMEFIRRLETHRKGIVSHQAKSSHFGRLFKLFAGLQTKHSLTFIFLFLTNTIIRHHCRFLLITFLFINLHSYVHLVNFHFLDGSGAP